MKNNPLNNIKIASPCSADWNEMNGDERKRFCGQCKLTVYNLSEMTQTEAENYLFEAEGRVCVKFYKRKDGTVITQNCPVGFAKVKQRVSQIATATFGLIMGVFGGLFGNFINSKLNEAVEIDQKRLATKDAKKEEIREAASKGNGAGIDFEIYGTMGNLPRIQLEIFTKRFPSE